MLIVDYIVYFLDYKTVKESIKITEKEYIRFSKVKKKNKKGSSNSIAVYITLHLVILFITIMVG